MKNSITETDKIRIAELIIRTKKKSANEMRWGGEDRCVAATTADNLGVVMRMAAEKVKCERCRVTESNNRSCAEKTKKFF